MQVLSKKKMKEENKCLHIKILVLVLHHPKMLAHLPLNNTQRLFLHIFRITFRIAYKKKFILCHREEIYSKLCNKEKTRFGFYISSHNGLEMPEIISFSEVPCNTF